MVATLVLVLVAVGIISSSDGVMARSNLGIQRELLQQNGDHNGRVTQQAGDGSGSGYPSSGGGDGENSASSPVYESDPPTDPEGCGIAPSYDPTPIPTQPGSGSGSTDHPSIPDIPIPGSSPIDPGAGHGSCDFWSSNFGSWPHILSTMSSIVSIFGKPASSIFPSSMTLLQALQNRKSDSYNSLLKQASASLLNSYAYKNFEFSPEDVKRMFGAALSSPEAAAAQASQFARANLRLK